MRDDKSASVQYRLAKLLKHLDNRQCADCSVPLLEWQNYYGSLSHQVWMCNTCYEAYTDVLGDKGLECKRIKDTWTEDEITKMEKAGSNVAQNKLFERYPHADWKNLTPESSYAERVQWIKAKYMSRYFTIPPLVVTNIKKKHSAHDIGYASTLPMRTADYFVTLGPGKAKGRVTAGKSITDIHFQVDVLSSFPNERFYTDHPSPIPDLLGPMVFPKGLKLSRREERPYCFTFVLTDTYRVKQFGTVLVVHELIEPRAVQSLMTQRRNSTAAVAATPEHHGPADSDEDGKVLYAPKALVVLSHYPFFHLFTRFLEQIYHLSISSAPLPIERYIANFLLELPLPPQGRIEVLFSLPEHQLQISRPPRNQLPMVDFSYRPLFAFLSVDNILAVFACLCQEMSVCICSRNIALLTPVQEALLSLLFPFVWQGCYVPVLPADMAELLHAPVPLLTGMQVEDISETFLDDDPTMRPSGLVIVHLDSDTVHYGSDCHPLPLPKAMLPKLRQKLVEHGSALHQLPEELVSLGNADMLYPNDEHMRPMKNFIAAQGVLSSIHPPRAPGGASERTQSTAGNGITPRRLSNFQNGGSSQRTVSGNDYPDDASDTSSVMSSATGTKRGVFMRNLLGSAPPPPKPAKDQKYQHVSSYHHPAACTLDAGTRYQAAGASFTSRRYPLDPAFNQQSDISQFQSLPAGAIDFNAMEVRGAFLRFFVAAFIDYNDFFVDPLRPATLPNGKKAPPLPPSKGSSLSVDTKSSAAAKLTLDSTSRPKSDAYTPLTSAQTGSSGFSEICPPSKKTFEQSKFLAKQEDSFLKHMAASQMFANFVSEIIDDPFQPEIKFFNEHIIAKRNRSKFALTKASTPFLDDTSEDIAQSFTVPGPVTASVPQGQSFSYTSAFPMFDLKQLQVVVTERGLAATGGAGGTLVREHGHGPEVSRLQRGESPEVMRDRVRLQFGPTAQGLLLAGSAAGTSLNTMRRTLVGLGDMSDVEEEESGGEEQQNEDIFFYAARRRYESVVRGITKVQAGIRARPARKQFFKKRAARLLLQAWLQRNRLRQVINRRIRAKAASRLQRMLRALLARRQFLRTLHRVVVLQSLQRARKHRALFLKMKARCQYVQAWYRGITVRRAQRKKAQSQWLNWRRQVMYLWSADCTPLQYRSSFWTQLNDQHSFLVQALYQQELRRLYENLGMIGGSGVPKAGPFAEQFRVSQGLPIILKLGALHSSQQHTASEINAQTLAIVDEALRGSAKLTQVAANRRELDSERKALYFMLRDERYNDTLFRLFGLTEMKKRKQKLSDLVWVCCNDEYATKSSNAVLTLHKSTLPTKDAPIARNSLTIAVKSNQISGEAEWALILKQRRIAYDCAEVAKACITSLQRERAQAAVPTTASPRSSGGKKTIK